MSSIGSSSNAGNKGKGKEIAVEEPPEKQQLSKGKEIVPVEEESDGYEPDSDSDYWESDSEEDDQQQEKNNNKKKPAWLETLLRTRFWDPCEEHGSMNRADQCIFCLNLKCFKVTCPRCTHRKPGHRLLKIRRYVYRSVVHASDMQDLGIDVSKIQTYVINARRVLHLRPMNRSKHFRPQAGTPRCVTCRTWLRSTPNLYCSLVCEGNFNVSQDDFSGPEAELRYRSLQAQLGGKSSEVAEELPGPDEPEAELPEPEVEPPPPAAAANQNGSVRKRSRKQAAPERAPFF